jgi:hypothetical protein
MSTVATPWEMLLTSAVTTRWEMLSRLLLTTDYVQMAGRRAAHWQQQLVCATRDRETLCEARGHGHIEISRQPHERPARQCMYCGQYM